MFIPSNVYEFAGYHVAQTLETLAAGGVFKPQIAFFGASDESLAEFSQKLNGLSELEVSSFFSSLQSPADAQYGLLVAPVGNPMPGTGHIMIDMYDYGDRKSVTAAIDYRPKGLMKSFTFNDPQIVTSAGGSTRIDPMMEVFEIVQGLKAFPRFDSLAKNNYKSRPAVVHPNFAR